MAIDLTPILNLFAASDVDIDVMSVGATLCGLYVVIFACMNLLAVLRGGEAWSWGLASHLEWFEKACRNKEFKRRYQHELKSRRYSEWKKSKGL